MSRRDTRREAKDTMWKYGNSNRRTSGPKPIRDMHIPDIIRVVKTENVRTFRKHQPSAPTAHPQNALWIFLPTITLGLWITVIHHAMRYVLAKTKLPCPIPVHHCI